MIFGKKKNTEEPKIDTNYANWDKDLGFLIMQINREVGYIVSYEIPTQMSVIGENKAEFLKDDDIKDLHRATTDEIYTDLSDNYKKYLTTKYFKDDTALVKFISEAVYTALIDAAISANNDKIQKQNTERITKQITELNKSVNKI